MPYEPTTNFVDSDDVDLGKKLVTKDYLLEVYGTILENSPASGLVVTPELWTWGLRGQGRLGNNTTSVGDIRTPVTTTAGGTNWKQVDSGYDHAAAIKTDGTLWIWGQTGVHGTNDSAERRTPVTTFAGGTDWKQVSCGKRSTGAIKTDGSLWVWGNNAFGQLGVNDTTERLTPVTTFIGGNTWKQVYMVDGGGGRQHTLAIKTDGSLWTWGGNEGGQLGIGFNGDSTGRTTPVTTFIGGNDWKSISGGRGYSVAIKTNGTLWVWGGNGSGTLGINDSNIFTIKNTPVTTFAGGTDWKQVGGHNNTAAIKTDGTLWVWGYNAYGQLGVNDTTNRLTPVTTFAGGTNWKSVGGGHFHTTAIKTDGSLWVWGRNTSGQLGTNDITPNRNTPVTTFAGGNDWKQVSGGREHSQAIKSIDYI